MSNIFGPYTRTAGGSLPVSTGEQDHDSQHLWLDSASYISVVTDGAIHHHGAGLPFSSDGDMVTGAGEVSYVCQGVPFTAQGRVAVAQGARAYADQGVWFTATGHVAGTGSGVGPVISEGALYGGVLEKSLYGAALEGSEYGGG